MLVYGSASRLLGIVALAVISNGVLCNSLLHNGGGGKNTDNHQNALDDEMASRSGPYFDTAASKNVTALLGKTTYLNCRVKNLGNKTQMMLQVSWVRHRDIHLLTIGRYTYTSDQRFRAIHNVHSDDWTLQIKYPQHRDSGIYECQVSTTPHMSHFVHLNIVEPTTEIVGGPDLYINHGSTINLTCIVLHSPEPPAYIFWNHNDEFSGEWYIAAVTMKSFETPNICMHFSVKTTSNHSFSVVFPVPELHRDVSISFIQNGTLEDGVTESWYAKESNSVAGPITFQVIAANCSSDVTMVGCNSDGEIQSNGWGIILSKEKSLAADILNDLMKQIISYDSSRGGVSVVTEKGDSTTSFLLVQYAKPNDSGKYTCNPSNAQPKSITVHVLNGEYPAAMQHGGQAKQPRLYSLLLCLCLLLY